MNSVNGLVAVVSGSDSSTAAEIDDLETDLPWLHGQCIEVGRPYYYCNERGTWSVTLHVPTERAGCSAEISSGFGHRTLSDAMRAVLERAREAAS